MRDLPIIAAVVLAAGASRRFGNGNKLLATVEDQPLVARVIAAIEAGGIDRVVVVTGHEPDRIAQATAGRGRRITYNERHGRGMGTSIAAGIKALDSDVDGALIAQGDMPAIDASLVAALCRCFVDGGGDSIVHPVLGDGRQGNPVIWPRRLFADLRRLAGDKGGKRLIEAEGGNVLRIAVAGSAAATDIDTAAEFSAYLASRSSQPT
jgi:molybdenum cofactor cytidylyltransferase